MKSVVLRHLHGVIVVGVGEEVETIHGLDLAPVQGGPDE
jgi:hypothetical protein